MSHSQLKTYVKAQPFVPFTIHTADGRSFRVAHEDYISQSPYGRTVIVYTTGESHVVLDSLMITGLDVETAHEQVK